MARPREFDIDQAVRDATEVFWTLGYGGASLEELGRGTGLAKGSLYKAFDDKRALFLAVLSRYVGERLERFALRLNAAGSPKAAIRAVMLDYAERAASGNEVRGCLVTNTATEMGASDPEVARHLTRLLGQMEKLFEDAIERAKTAGEMCESKDARAIARFLVLTIQGLRVMSHLRPRRPRILQAVEVALSTLE